MKKLVAIICFLMFAFAASAATLRLDPGLSAPGVADGARLDAAVLVSTNAVATAQVAAVYELPAYGEVESVTVSTNDYYTLSTNVVIGTNSTVLATDLYTVTTNSGVVATNYFLVWTNSWPVMVNRPTVTTTTNTSWEVVSYFPVTNDLFTLTASAGYAETNRVDRWIAPGARLLLTGEPVTLFFR
ncbi:MAG: hypothetical protein J6V72_08925 [Kiritimatiellae bacterium]|nr:hypothetical protein [Kiritimatiellia bacterium]